MADSELQETPLAAPVTVQQPQAPSEAPPQQPEKPADLDEDAAAREERAKQLQEESDKLAQLQQEIDQAKELLQEDKADVDARSIYVGNVDYGTTPEELQQHFQSCGTINRVSIMADKYTGQPKGYAYIEFAEPALVAQAVHLNESPFRGRPLKVLPKRTNKPGMSARGRGRGRGGFRGGFRGYRGGFRGGRGGRGGYNPY